MINLDYPSNSEDYVHRIGRTGRSQRTGTAYAFFTPGNAHKASDLIQVLEEAKQVVNPKLYELSRNPSVYKSKCFFSLRFKILEERDLFSLYLYLEIIVKKYIIYRNNYKKIYKFSLSLSTISNIVLIDD